MAQPPQPEPLAFLLTWTTYGTWLPGDARGWFKKRTYRQETGDAVRLRRANELMSESAVILSPEQRQVVDAIIRRHAEVQEWNLLAVNARTNHVHVVIGYAGINPKIMRQQFKQWSTRELKKRDPARKKWWTEEGSCRHLNHEEHVEAAVEYVLNGQDGRRFEVME
ncbi:transposase [Stratiformator vulcanicus]|uniref:Transposase IS200 like protein n=1 Tax=Stratiformator vulcanicus TaxID=2527980 RepID=A0A517R7N9_9PLAN|nr:transposase [Stratiformator vulcanicus]QDT39843.1 Transposase IS200 like protein [Stratiformator vulcanicus]